MKKYIKCGGLQWAPQNAGTDEDNPDGKLYTFDEALALENDTWRLPTQKEFDEFLDRTCHGFDKERKLMIFIDRETGARFELPAVGYRHFSDGVLYDTGTRGLYWSSTQYSSTTAYYLYFSSGDVTVGSSNKAYGFSVRCIRK